MRSGELCGLRVDNIDLDRRLVSVQQSVWHGKVQAPKTDTAFRGFALSPNMVEHLRAFLVKWRPNVNGLLFSTRTGSPWDSNLLVKRKLKPLLEKLEIRSGGLHAFRHGNATLMDRLGVPMKVRQQRLGHSDAKMTLGTYTHIASEDDVSIAERLGGILDPNGVHEHAIDSRTGCTLTVFSGSCA